MPGDTYVPTSYCLVFGESDTPFRHHIDDVLGRRAWRREWEEHEGKLFLTITAPFQLIAMEAERVKLEKQLTAQRGPMARFHLSRLNDFRGSSNKITFFSPAELCQLTWSALEDTKFSKTDFGKGLARDLNEKLPFITALKSCKASKLEDAYPLHSDSAKRAFNRMVSFRIVNLENAVRHYFGEEIAFYFVWMLFFAKWLVIPAIAGFLLYVIRPEGVTIDNSPYIPLYSLCVPVWGIFFLKFWQRHMNATSFQWNAHDFEEEEALRPQFWGSRRVSPVTGKVELHFDPTRRYLHYFVSFLVMIPMLCIAVIAMCVSLNLNNYVRDEESPLYIGTLAAYAQPGGIFAADNPYYGWLVPTILHSVVISILNKVYRTIAVWSTDFENHRTEEEWEKSFITKRVLFEAFDCYLALFYIAFYRFDVVALRNELIGLFSGDELRRIGVEVILPLVTMVFSRKRTTRKLARQKTDGGDEPVELSKAILNSTLEEYDAFDDYLEMVIQFGYITLFASAFPLCSGISIIFVVVETITDSVKLLYIYRRPRARRAGGIGVWYSVMYAMVIVSILTNCFILGFSSEQLMQWMPGMFKYEDGDQQFKMGYGRYVVGLVFTLEHVLLLLTVTIEYLIPSCPADVQTAMARRKYMSRQWLEQHEADIAGKAAQGKKAQ